jgi:hypothetical protein
VSVTIGGAPCQVTANSATSITCTFGSNSGLTANSLYQIEVNVDNIGYALHQGAFQLQFMPIVTSLTPSTGSIQGGTLVTIAGDGFNKQTIFSLGGSSNNNNLYWASSNVISLTSTSIVLQTVAEPANVQTNLALFINQVSVNCTSCAFAFSSAVAPLVTAVSPASVTQPNTELTLTGSSFGTDSTQFTVSIGASPCAVSSVTDTSITCTVAGVSLGANNVNVNFPAIGNAIVSAAQVVGYGAIVSVAPSSGSIHGGTTITITGNGFAKGMAFSGNSFNCQQLNVTSVTQAVCVTGANQAQASTLQASLNTT